MARFQELVSIETEGKTCQSLMFGLEVDTCPILLARQLQDTDSKKKDIKPSIPLNTSSILMVQTKPSVKENSSLNV